jgi:dihydropteroate synthase
MSSRPGAAIISSEIELERIAPVVKSVRQAYPKSCISVDTIHASTAQAVLEMGADIINDISGGRYDEEMLNVVATYGDVPFVCMHMQGLPENMQADPDYDDVVHEILQFFAERLASCRAAGIKDVIIDPGFGFGKTVEHNYQILRKLGVFEILEVPILAGLSRKSAVNRVLGIPPAKALNGTTVLNTIALLNGARILRVHDVRQAVEAIQLCEYYRGVGENPDQIG